MLLPCPFKSNKKTLFLLLIFLYFSMRFIFFDASYLFNDEAAYVHNAYWFSGTEPFFNEISFRPPLVSFMLSPIILLTRTETIIKIYPVILNFLAVIAVYLLGREINERVGVLAAIIIALFPFHIQTSRWIMTDTPMIAFAALAMLFYYKGLKNKNMKQSIIGGIFLTLTALTKFTGLFLIFVLIPLFAFFIKGNAKNILISLATALLVASPYLAMNYIIFGNPALPLEKGSAMAMGEMPMNVPVVLWSVYDFFGALFLITLAVSIFLGIKSRERYKLFLIYMFAAMLFLYFFLMGRGVAVPTGIEWEIERILIPALPFAAVLVSDLLLKIKNPQKIITAFLVVFMISMHPQYIRAYTPAVDLENGLRNATVTAGEYVSQNLPPGSVYYCNFNCPSIAYYIKRKMIVFEHWTDGFWDTLPESPYLVFYTNQPPSRKEISSRGFYDMKVFDFQNYSIIVWKR